MRLTCAPRPARACPGLPGPVRRSRETCRPGCVVMVIHHPWTRLACGLCSRPTDGTFRGSQWWTDGRTTLPINSPRIVATTSCAQCAYRRPQVKTRFMLSSFSAKLFEFLFHFKATMWCLLTPWTSKGSDVPKHEVTSGKSYPGWPCKSPSVTTEPCTAMDRESKIELNCQKTNYKRKCRT